MTKKPKAEETVDAELVVEAITEEEGLPVHSFKLEVNNGKYFDNDYVVQCGLPEFAVSNRLGQKVLEGPTAILVTMVHGPNVTANLLKAGKEQELDFKIHLLLDDKVYSTWALNQAYIGGIKFGHMSKIPATKPEDELIQCEIIFCSIEVDDVTI